MTSSRRCPYCQQFFLPSAYRPQQVVCGQAECQLQRRRAYHRQKLRSDSLYQQVARDSQKQWRDEHPDYLRQYRAQHPEAVARNRELQQRRDLRRRLPVLAKNNLAFCLTRSAAEVWLIGSRVARLEKNNLASSQVVIFSPVAREPALPAGA